MKILVINGPNLNMLGIREKNIYGTQDYKSLVEFCEKAGADNGVEVTCFQSNHEGSIVDKIQEAYFEGASGIVINPGAYTHTSIAILDAVKSTMLPTVEVHISKLDEREAYRQTSYVREAAIASIIGRGISGYGDAVEFLIEHINRGK